MTDGRGKKEDVISLIRFAEAYMKLSEEDKRLVFAFTQGVETRYVMNAASSNVRNSA